MAADERALARSIRSFAASRIDPSAPNGRTIQEEVAVEEPLEVRINDEPFSVTMRTPGHDRELVLGFLLAEGIIESVLDVFSLGPCGRPGEEGYGNAFNVQLVSPPKVDDKGFHGAMHRRGTLMTSACGVCGRQSITDLVGRVQPLSANDTRIKSSLLSQAVLDVRERQSLFNRTGGSHAACLVTPGGELLALYEDVGRHNAVDKVIGSRVLSRTLPASNGVLVVSGRTSFEIVQKAFTAGIPVVAAISAPSSLAIDLALRANITLVGFVRGNVMTVYTNPARVFVP
jgi:FdhD protein